MFAFWAIATVVSSAKAIVEYVRDGCTLRAFLLPKYQYVTIMLTGIKTPGFKRSTEGKDVPEPFAGRNQSQSYIFLTFSLFPSRRRLLLLLLLLFCCAGVTEEAKFFTESRLLQREVQVVLEGVSGNNNFLATVLHPAGNIAEFLVREGANNRIQD